MSRNRRASVGPYSASRFGPKSLYIEILAPYNPAVCHTLAVADAPVPSAQASHVNNLHRRCPRRLRSGVVRNGAPGEGRHVTTSRDDDFFVMSSYCAAIPGALIW